MPNLKTVLVTGARLGIGKALAKRLLAEGHRVIGTSRDPESLDNGDPAFSARPLDLSHLCASEKVVREFTAGCGHLDAAVLNAGYGRFGSLEEFSHAQINDLLQVNLVAQVHLARALVRQFKRQGRGDLVFIGSESALEGGRQGAVYSAAKFGIRGFCQALRKECAGRGVRVGLVNPGMVASSFFDDLGFAPGPEPENRIRPEQVADAVMLMLNSHANVVWDEINLTPLKKVVRRRPPECE